MASFRKFFQQVTGHEEPRDWQAELGDSSGCLDRLIRVPTGMGKTEGVLAAWLWNAVEQARPDWPRRLVWCLPMRVLVEQTARSARQLVERWQKQVADGARSRSEMRVSTLMGGVDSDEWHLRPHELAILVGTQDMLLSRALNRGYAAGRARWPVEFGLLNHDCLWVMDEVQLMDVGLATSVQLQAFREQERGQRLRPCHTWWMSATLQPDWLDTVDFRQQLTTLRSEMLQIPRSQRRGDVWRVRKPLTVQTIPQKDKTDKDATSHLVATVLAAHRDATPKDTSRVTLVIVNRVDSAQELFRALREAVDAEASSNKPQLELIHSRFRGIERQSWVDEFLSREHCEDSATNRIIVATQVVEAGVDISATALVTDLAPWPSLVQRFGRAARYGGTAKIVVIDRKLGERDAAPYEKADLDAARDALAELEDVGQAHLEDFEMRLRSEEAKLHAKLYRYEYLHLLTRRECDDLFDTSPDLTGADLDISRFIRSGDERDVQVCWVNVGDGKESNRPPPDFQPQRDVLCRVPVYAAAKWLLDGSKTKEGCRAWGWSYLDGQWTPLTRRMCFSGQVILVDAAWGGYDPTLGFIGEKRKKNEAPVAVPARSDPESEAAKADAAQGRDDLSKQNAWKTIATHGREVANVAQSLAASLGLDESWQRLLSLAGRVHDWGKAHPAFQFNIRPQATGHPGRDDLAKAPASAWVPYQSGDYARPERLRQGSPHFGKRAGFRHELASALALFELLAQHAPDHAALVGPYRELVEQGVLSRSVRLSSATGLLEKAGVRPASESGRQAASLLVKELVALDADQFNLLAYLVCCHHGKVRGTWQATPQDQEFVEQDGQIGAGQPLRGVRDGDPLPPVLLAGSDGTALAVPSLTLHLDLSEIGLSSRFGPSWSDRVQSLVEKLGPFALAFLEALLRAADCRASQLDTADPLLTQESSR